MEIDRAHLRILEVLAQNCRISDAELARSLKVSKDTVRTRIRKLEEAGLLSAWVLFIDARKLGFTRYHILVQLREDSRSNQFVREISRHPFVMWVNTFVGLYDFQIIVDAVDGFHLNTIREELFSICHNKIRNYIILTHLSDLEFTHLNPTINLGTRFNREQDHSFSGELSTRRFPVTPRFERVKVNRIDLDVLRILASDPRASIVSISDNVGCERQTVKRRICQLIHSEVIINFGGIPNLSMLGFVTYYLLVRLDQNVTREEMMRPFRELNNIFYAGHMIGEYDMILYLNARTPIELKISIELFRSQLRGKIYRLDLMIQDKVVHWRQFTEGIYKHLAGNL
jgi:DNA-binding Lrp family transcriptional regulator